MKQIGILFLLVVLFTACGAPGPDQTTESPEAPAEIRQPVAKDSFLLSDSSGQIRLVQNDQAQTIDLSDGSLGEAAPYHAPVMETSAGRIYHQADQLLLQTDSEQAGKLLIDQVAQIKPVYRGLLVKTSQDELIAIDDQAEVHPITSLAQGDDLDDILVTREPVFVIKNNPADETFSAYDVAQDSHTIDITGRAIVSLSEQAKVILQSPEQPGKLGQLDLTSGDTTWFDFGTDRSEFIIEPKRLNDQLLIMVYDNQSQAELVMFNLSTQQLQSTVLGPTAELIGIREGSDNLLIHMRQRIYRSDLATMDYIEYSATKVVETARGLILIKDNHVRVINDELFKDYQYPGKVLSAQLSSDKLVVIYQADDSEMLVIDTIDF